MKIGGTEARVTSHSTSPMNRKKLKLYLGVDHRSGQNGVNTQVYPYSTGEYGRIDDQGRYLILKTEGGGNGYEARIIRDRE